MKILIQLFILTILLLPTAIKASNDILIESFEIMPTICVVARDKSCQQKIRFQWRLSQVGASCLYRDGQSNPLYCSKKQ